MNISQFHLNQRTGICFLEQTKMGCKDMFDLATLALVLGLFALPFVFLGYVHSRVRHELKAIAEVN